jgi:hypothetical protein
MAPSSPAVGGAMVVTHDMVLAAAMAPRTWADDR